MLTLKVLGVITLVICVVVLVFLIREPTTCPKCGKKAVVSSSGANRSIYTHCNACGELIDVISFIRYE
ncbi:MAG: hypothetical protein ABIE68_01830 [bacterium]